MSLHFVFPRDFSQPALPEEMFADQWAALGKAGFSKSLCSDAVLAGKKPLRNIPSGSQVVYRGWMVKSHEYECLVTAIDECGATALTTLKEYLTAHHLPSWYPLLSDLTPETRIYSADVDIAAELTSLNWDAYFLKDYVKSLKTSRGSIIRDPSEAPAVIAEMRDYRGEIEGGICVRRVEDLVPDSEHRYFVLFGVCYGPANATVPDIIRICAQRVPSKFFSVDVAERRDGQLRVIEVGDGQVSDLVGWTPDEFAAIWCDCSARRDLP